MEIRDRDGVTTANFNPMVSKNQILDDTLDEVITNFSDRTEIRIHHVLDEFH